MLSVIDIWLSHPLLNLNDPIPSDQVRIAEHLSATEAATGILSPSLPPSLLLLSLWLRINHALGSVTVFHFVGLSLGNDQGRSSR